MISLPCPHCDKTLRIPEKDIGKKGKCTACGGSFMVMMMPPDTSDDEAFLEYDPRAENSRAVKDRIRRDMAARKAPADLLGLHQVYQDLIQAYVKECTHDPQAIYLVAQAALQQVDIARMVAKSLERRKTGRGRPRHAGFEQLTAIRERQGRYEEAVRLAEEAKAQGWAGDWDKRIARCKATTVIKKSR